VKEVEWTEPALADMADWINASDVASKKRSSPSPQRVPVT